MESINKETKPENANTDGITVEKRTVNVNGGEGAKEQKDAAIAEPKDEAKTSAPEPKKSSKLPLIITLSVIVLAGLIFLFCKLPAATTGLIRDIALIVLVIESIVALIAFVVMSTRLAQLFNFLKYELKPILDNTQKTVKRFSGTVSFLCDNAVEPTITAAAKVSGFQSAVNGVLGIFKKL